MEQRPPIQQTAWGLLGAVAAAWFAIWMLFFPQFVPEYFAWDVHPRAAQVFIGAAYIFRTFFIRNAAREGNWIRLRWIVYGNLVFTGTLLFGTYWHLSEFHWNPLQTPLAHIWIILYIFEPISMLYLIPRGALHAEAPLSGGRVNPWLRRFLIFTTGILLMNGLLIVGAWFLGWAVWGGTMAFATDWDEIKRACQLFILNGAVLFVAAVVFRDEFLPGRATALGYTGGLALLTLVMTGFYLLQERSRPAAVTTSP
jgi:hypothetical protein